MIDSGERNAYVDDVNLLTESKMALKELLDQASRWARLAGMICNMARPELIGAKHSCCLAGAPLEITSETTYVSITINKRGVQQGQLFFGLHKAQNISINTAVGDGRVESGPTPRTSSSESVFVAHCGIG